MFKSCPSLWCPTTPGLQVTATIQPVREVSAALHLSTPQGAIRQAGLFASQLALHVQGPPAPLIFIGWDLFGSDWLMMLMVRSDFCSKKENEQCIQVCVCVFLQQKLRIPLTLA